MGLGVRKIIKKDRQTLIAIHDRQNPQYLIVETLTALQRKSALTSTLFYKEKNFKKQDVLKNVHLIWWSDGSCRIKGVFPKLSLFPFLCPSGTRVGTGWPYVHIDNKTWIYSFSSMC